jgi:hypothetical protein
MRIGVAAVLVRQAAQTIFLSTTKEVRMITFPPKRDFFSLSLTDLIEAREAYHVHLDSIEHIVATAIGRFRIRKKDSDFKNSGKVEGYGKGGPRTFANSEILDWSWPCVLVLSDYWYTPEELNKQPYFAIPPYLFMPDGRVIPTCLIYLEPSPQQPPAIEQVSFPSKTLGGGYTCFTESQQVQRAGTIGCLAKKEGALYALTCAHVAGAPGNKIYTYLRSNKETIGTSHPVRISKRKFGEVYPKWPGGRTLVNVDAALVQVSDASAWTSQVFGIGEIGRMIDFSPEAINLDILGTPVRAFSPISGPMEGEIQGLFPRYCSKGGVDSVADLLIGPREPRQDLKPGVSQPELNSQPGDSGTLWFFDPPSKEAARSQDARARSLRPLAIQWGGERFTGGDGKPIQLVLATFLSTVCQLLDIDLVTDANLGFSEYWGKIAHFKIGFKACDIVRTPKLKKLLTDNQERIGFDDGALKLGKDFRVGRENYVPLADVPDYVWISMSFNRSERKKEPKQHFADMDDPGRGKFAGQTLLDLCRKDPKNLDPKVWKEFYAALSDANFEYDGGYLPFRIWQIYRAMVAYLKQGNVKDFLAAAGVLAHYVADAGMPFHISKLHHGYGPERVDRKSPEYEEYKKSKAYKVHAILEERMFEVKALEMLSYVNGSVDSFTEDRKKAPAGEFGAVKHAFGLMNDVLTLVPPTDVVEQDDLNLNAPDRARAFFGSFGKATADCVAKSCVVLADLWESAWAEGLDGADAPPANKLRAYSEADLQAVYRRPDFLPAYNLEDYIGKGFKAPSGR